MTVSLTESRFRDASFWRNVFASNPEEGTTLDDMKAESYWAHVAKFLRPWDKIEVRAEDGTFYAEFIVRDSGRNWAKVELVKEHVFNTAGVEARAAADPEYITKYAGPHAKYRVTRKSDKAVMRDGFASEAEGDQWIKEHIKSLVK